jgi:cysteinyl-tRNA synthetase
MSSAFLGPTFDIHTGGIDHIPIHHTNEIAQSENAFEEVLARYWLHTNFLTIKDEKISKSLSNEILLSDIRAKGFSPIALRYFVLGAHYRSEQNFTWEALEAASNALEKLSLFVDSLSDTTLPGDPNQEFRLTFEKAINDDLNTPQALAVAWSVVRSSLPDAEKLATLLLFDRVLGLKLGSRELDVIPEQIEKLAVERQEARIREEWDLADRIRKHIEELGYTVDDTENGPRIRTLRTK